MKGNTKINLNSTKPQKATTQVLSQTIVKKVDPKARELEDKINALQSEVSRLKIKSDDISTENEKLKLRAGEPSNLQVRAFQGSELIGKTYKESTEQIEILTKHNEEVSVAIKVLRSEHNKLIRNNNSEIAKSAELEKNIQSLENQIKESKEKNEELTYENNSLKENLKNTESALKLIESAIDSQVKSNDKGYTLQDELKIDSTKRDASKRNSIASSGILSKKI
jgi:chromosome segregation ATPase